MKETGDTAGSAAIRALRKPTLAAWLANHLVRAVPDRVAELTEFGEELRAAHLSVDGPRLRELTPRRRELVQNLVDTAKAETAAMGRQLTGTVTERLTETLDAALVDPGAAQLLRSGRLTSALRHVGFGVVDESGAPAAVPVLKLAKSARPATTARAERPPVRSVGKGRKSDAKAAADRRAAQRRRKELQERLAEVEAEYTEAENDRRAAEAELDANEHHITDMHTAIERLTEELEQARRELRQAQRRTSGLERALTRAMRAAAAARRRRDAQQERLAAFNE